MSEPAPLEPTVQQAVQALSNRNRRFAPVGGIAVSVRAEVRFTRGVDFAVAVSDDADAEQLVLDLQRVGYTPIAVVEHDTPHRLSTARLRSPSGVTLDLLLASCGIEPEIVERAEAVDLPSIGLVPVARAEELLAMTVLSMTPKRLKDRMDLNPS